MNEDHKQNFVDVAILENIIEAQVIESILTEQNIPHRIRSYHDTAYDGLFQVQKGWGQLCAPHTYKQEIIDILNDIRSREQTGNVDSNHEDYEGHEEK
ncbi:MAG: hypothetical protein H8D96_15725 [Desulfobacterales bacterium]|uniref:DUF2007 domain-containing protein n=1 Tax=Candidatus Desulfatibia vada TaxID=2841696 RepID=A0A8J6P136_9BACT|nr:hypothetical protein [Candidatus Desulfatibia vada]